MDAARTEMRKSGTSRTLAIQVLISANDINIPSMSPAAIQANAMFGSICEINFSVWKAIKNAVAVIKIILNTTSALPIFAIDIIFYDRGTIDRRDETKIMPQCY